MLVLLIDVTIVVNLKDFKVLTCGVVTAVLTMLGSKWTNTSTSERRALSRSAGEPTQIDYTTSYYYGLVGVRDLVFAQATPQCFTFSSNRCTFKSSR